ncbi:unnamed protein product, partial [Oikopleura dioica]
MLFAKLIYAHFAASFGVNDFEEKLLLEYVKSSALALGVSNSTIYPKLVLADENVWIGNDADHFQTLDRKWLKWQLLHLCSPDICALTDELGTVISTSKKEDLFHAQYKPVNISDFIPLPSFASNFLVMTPDLKTTESGSQTQFQDLPDNSSTPYCAQNFCQTLASKCEYYSFCAKCEDSCVPLGSCKAPAKSKKDPISPVLVAIITLSIFIGLVAAGCQRNKTAEREPESTREVCSIEEVTEDTTEEGAVFTDNERQSESPRAPLINNPPAKNAYNESSGYSSMTTADPIDTSGKLELFRLGMDVAMKKVGSKMKTGIDRIFDKTLQDLVRGVKNAKGHEREYILEAVEEIRE